MLKSHIYRISKNNISRLFFIIILLIPTLEIFQLSKEFNTDFNSNYLTFLSGASRGHLYQIILLWFLPIYTLLLIADDSIQDYKTGYKNILISKIGIKKYYKGKMFNSFIICFLTMFISLLLNLILINIFFGSESNNLNSINDLPNNILYSLSISYPFWANIFFILLASCLCGLTGVCGASLSLFLQDKKYVYAISFFIWFLLVLKQKSLMFLFQPFAEYDFNVLLPILIVVIAVYTLLPLSLYIYEVYFYEL